MLGTEGSSRCCQGFQDLGFEGLGCLGLWVLGQDWVYKASLGLGGFRGIRALRSERVNVVALRTSYGVPDVIREFGHPTLKGMSL